MELDAEIIETSSSLIGFGTRNGEPVVVKVPRWRSDERIGVAALTHFGERCCVRVLATGDNGTALLEQAMPGTHLTQLVLNGRDQEATEILCRIMSAIPASPTPATGFPSVEDWGHGFDRYAASADTSLPSALVGRAHALFQTLCQSQRERRLLHGDLHHDNVILDARRGWLVIDPKGVIGEPAYEAGAALRNPLGDPRWFAQPGIIETRVTAYATCANVPRERVIAWAYAQAALSAIWSVEDSDDPATGLAAAAAFEPLLAKQFPRMRRRARELEG